MDLKAGLPFLLLCAITMGSEVLLIHAEKPYVAVSQDAENPIELKDRVCVFRDQVDIACGDIIVSTLKYAIFRIDLSHEEIKKYTEKTKTENRVELDFQRPTPVKGDKVRLEQRDPKRMIRTLTSELIGNNTFAGQTISEERQGDIDLALKKLEDSRVFKPKSVLAAGMNYVFPHLQYQQAMSPKWGLGMMAMYMSYSVDSGAGSLTGPGMFFTYNRYYRGPLNGFWWQLSPGAFRMTVKNGTLTQSEVYQPVLLATVGWRHFWHEKMNFGFGLGTIYFPFGNGAGNTGLNFNGFVPSITIDGGIAF